MDTFPDVIAVRGPCCRKLAKAKCKFARTNRGTEVLTVLWHFCRASVGMGMANLESPHRLTALEVTWDSPRTRKVWYENPLTIGQSVIRARERRDQYAPPNSRKDGIFFDKQVRSKET